MPRTRKSSISEVAAAAGVSPTTVSHVLSGRRPVHPDTATRVRSAMRKLAYSPDHSAQSLARGATRTIGLVVADISSPYFAELAKGVGDAAYDLGFSVLVANTNWDEEREARSIEQLAAGLTDGLIYGAGVPVALGRVKSPLRGFPLVVVDERIDGLEAPYVVSDNWEGGRLIGDHLAGLEHRAALYIGGPKGLATSLERLGGFRAGFLSGDARDASVAEIIADYRLEGGFRAVQEALANGRNWTAVFAGNDLMAVGAIEALREAGLRVPQDVSVAGFDDTILARHVHPRLTTIRQPAHELGRTAAETLIASILRSEPLSPRQVVLAVSLVPGDSTGTARAIASQRGRQHRPQPDQPRGK